MGGGEINKTAIGNAFEWMKQAETKNLLEVKWRINNSMDMVNDRSDTC
jgi:hypothetical protein